MIRKLFTLIVAAHIALAGYPVLWNNLVEAQAQTIPNGAAVIGGGPGFVGFKSVGPCVDQVLAWAAGPLPACTNIGSLISGTPPINVSAGGVVSLDTPLASQYGGTGANLSAAATGSHMYATAPGVFGASGAFTGLMLSNGAGAPSAYGGAVCVDAIYQLSASGTPTCTTISAGANITITPSGTNPRDLSIASTAAGEADKPGFISGLMPHKPVDQTRVAWNPGAWYSSVQDNFSSFDTVAETELESGTVDWASTPAVGGMISGAMVGGSNATDGTEVFFYAFTRDSDEKPVILASSSDTFGTTRNFSAAISSPGVINFSVAHGLRKRMSIRVRSTGGTLPSPLGAGITYFVCTLPSVGEITVATSIANVNSGSCLNFTTASVAPVVADMGVVFEYSWCCSGTPATASRGIPWFAFVWDVSKYGPGTGIPNFNTGYNTTITTLTSAGDASAYRPLSAGAATSWTSIDLSPWLANINRKVTFAFLCATTAGGAGTCQLRPSGTSAGFTIANPHAASVNTYGTFGPLETTSATTVDYQVSTNARLSLWVMGWQATDPR